MKCALIKFFKKIMNFVYYFFKKLKTKNKITFISRQKNVKNIDFNLIIEEIKKKDKFIEIVVLNKVLKNSFFNRVKYFFHMFKQMYHISTSKIVILDGYCIVISILKHKKELKVIQIWHALGSLKKFGYSILGKNEGRNKELSYLMSMHKNYDYILTSSKLSKTFFKEAFNAKEQNMIVMPLPRVDFLKSKEQEEQVKQKFFRNIS